MVVSNEGSALDGDEERVFAKVAAFVALLLAEPKPIVKATDTLPAAHWQKVLILRTMLDIAEFASTRATLGCVMVLPNK